MNQNKNFIGNALKGMGMGIAEVIPGVSGGTIAFITGIYETLLNTIKAFSPELINTFKKDGIKGVWQAINGNFLVALMIGMVFGFIAGLFGISYLLEHYPILVWAFFFGLILASILYIGKQIDKWTWKEVLMLILGTVIAYFVTIATPAGGSESLLYVFMCGVIAISALILPGLSGSFMLLLLGMYQYILHDTLKEGILEHFNTQAFVTMGVFALGCLVGLLSFARLLSWTFKNYKNATFALLTGFMLGSLNKIWPWRKPIKGLDESGNLVEAGPGIVLDKIIKEINLLPSQYGSEIGDAFLVGAVVSMLFGFVIVLVLEKNQK